MADGDQITPEEYASWIPAPDAIKRVSSVMNDRSIAAGTIIRRVHAGLIRVYAKTGNVSQSGNTHKLKDYIAVPARITKAWEDSQYQGTLQFWVSGDAEISFEVRGEHGYGVTQTWRLFGIRFDPAGLAEMTPAPGPRGPIKIQRIEPVERTSVTPVPVPVPVPVAVEGNTVKSTSRAGRPPQDFWEDMIIAALKAIWYEATLQPKTQADVQRWMADWAIRNEHDPGETALKERARRVFLAYHDEGRK